MFFFYVKFISVVSDHEPCLDVSHFDSFHNKLRKGQIKVRYGVNTTSKAVMSADDCDYYLVTKLGSTEGCVFGQGISN